MEPGPRDRGETHELRHLTQLDLLGARLAGLTITSIDNPRNEICASDNQTITLRGPSEIVDLRLSRPAGKSDPPVLFIHHSFVPYVLLREGEG